MSELIHDLVSRDVPHEKYRAQTLSWATPKYLIDALGPFALDPCAAPEPRAYATAATMWGWDDSPLNRDWSGRVWLNPPYGKGRIDPWMRRMSQHGLGTALIFARVETAVFFEHVWQSASAIFFPRGRVRFIRSDGIIPRRHGGEPSAPSVLVAYGDLDAERLRNCGLDGQFLMIP